MQKTIVPSERTSRWIELDELEGSSPAPLRTSAQSSTSAATDTAPLSAAPPPHLRYRPFELLAQRLRQRLGAADGGGD
jgi:hypothetical protein